jgi:hypothetical protein
MDELEAQMIGRSSQRCRFSSLEVETAASSAG